MNIIQSTLTKNSCYTAGEKITVKGLMLHSVGVPQPSAAVFVKSWNRSNLITCVHAFIDGNTGDVYQTLPWNHRGWHAGGSANDTHIGVEMCEPACIKYIGGATFTCSDTATAKAVVQRTYDNAVTLFAHLCKQYNLDPLADGVIISHKEGNKRGLASNHGDPEHLWNQLKMGYTMDTFRKAVKNAMGTTTTEVLYKVQVGAFANKDNAEKMLAKVKAAGFDAVIVEVKTDNAKPEAVEPEPEPIPEVKVGSKVKIKAGAKTYTGGGLASFVYKRTYVVKELNGDRAVLTYSGTVVCAMHTDNLTLV